MSVFSVENNVYFSMVILTFWINIYEGMTVLITLPSFQIFRKKCVFLLLLVAGAGIGGEANEAFTPYLQHLKGNHENQ